MTFHPFHNSPNPYLFFNNYHLADRYQLPTVRVNSWYRSPSGCSCEILNCLAVEAGIEPTFSESESVFLTIERFHKTKWWERWDSNPHLSDPQSDALPIKLQIPCASIAASHGALAECSRPLVMDYSASLSVVSQLLSVCVPSGCLRMVATQLNKFSFRAMLLFRLWYT